MPIREAEDDEREMMTAANVIAALLTLIPLAAAAFFPRAVKGCPRGWPAWAQSGPGGAGHSLWDCDVGGGDFAGVVGALRLALPVASGLCGRRRAWIRNWILQPGRGRELPGWLRRAASEGHGGISWCWGRWGWLWICDGLEGAWPAHLAIFSKMMLLDAGIYGFMAVRNVQAWDSTCGCGCGIWELECGEWIYTPLALVLGLGLGFLHAHGSWPGLGPIGEAWIFTFFFIAVPEELFFRGWLQGVLERRVGRLPALLATAMLFGLSHFNKRAAGFNWRYVLLAALAGIFYGRAWRQGAAGGCVGGDPCDGGAIWVAMASVGARRRGRVGWVAQIAEADAHVVVNGAGNGVWRW